MVDSPSAASAAAAARALPPEDDTRTTPEPEAKQDAPVTDTAVGGLNTVRTMAQNPPQPLLVTAGSVTPAAAGTTASATVGVTPGVQASSATRPTLFGAFNPITWGHDKVIDLTRSAIDKLTGASGHIKQLGAGDSYTLAARVDVALGVGVKGGGSVTVQRNTDGSGYTVSQQVSGEAEIKAAAGLSAGGTATLTYSATTPQEAQKLAMMLLTGPKSKEGAFAEQHLQSVELGLTGTAEAELARLGVGTELANIGAAGKLDLSARINFQDGRPTSLTLVERTTLNGDAATQLGAKVQSHLGVPIPQAAEAVATNELTLPGKDALALAATVLAGGDLRSVAARFANATVDSSFDFKTKGSGSTYSGFVVHAETNGLNRTDAKSFIDGLRTGRISPSLIASLREKTDAWAGKYDYHDGSPLDAKVKIAGEGASLETEASTTDITSRKVLA